MCLPVFWHFETFSLFKDGSLAADLSQKPGRQEAKQHGVVGLAVEPRHADVTELPQLALPAVQRPGGGRDINQNNVGAALDEPPPKVDLGENGEMGEREKDDFNSPP